MSVILLGIAFAMIVMMAFLAGVEKGRSVITGIVCAIGASAILGPLLLLIGTWESERDMRVMAAEIGDPAYARIAEQKGRSCAVDTRVAKAMRDGRITGAEYETIMELATRERLKGAKSVVAGIAPGATCANPRGAS